MKIIHLVLGKANPERMNGVNKVAYQLATTQTEMGHEVHLWGIANSMTKNYPDRNFSTTLFRQFKNKLKLDSNLVDAIKSLDSDAIVHIHGSFIPEFYQVAKLLTRGDVPYVYTPHGALTEGAMVKNNFIKKLYFELFESALIKNAKAMQLLGIQELEYTKNLIKSEFATSADIPQQTKDLFFPIGRDGVERENAYAGEIQYFKQGAYNQTNGKAPETNIVWSAGADIYEGDIAKQYANGDYTEVWFKEASTGPGTMPEKE